MGFGRTLLGAALLGIAWGAAAAQALETRTYVVSSFYQGASSADGDCAGGINPDIQKQYELNLLALGKTTEEAADIVNRSGEYADGDLGDLMNDRGRVDGRPVNAYANPASVADPKLNAVTGKIAYGFDLDGKGADDPDGFEEPDTKQKGIDNQAFRALGCSRPYRGSKAAPGAYWAFVAVTVKDTSPAWLMSVTGEDLAKDGPVTITFDRALEYAKSNPDGSTRPYMTYRVDPDPRSHNEFKGEIKKGVLTITEHNPFFMTHSVMYAPHVKLKNTHLRMDMKADGSIDGFIGGYQPWRDVYFGVAWGGKAAETTVSGEIPGLFYLLRNHADADPDPETGENRDISITYRLIAVPAFHAKVDGPSRGTAR